MYRLRRPAALLMLAVVGLVAGVPAAYADTAAAPPRVPGTLNTEPLSTADKTRWPGPSLVTFLGDQVVPSTQAYEATTYQIDQWAAEGGMVGNISEPVSLVSKVPVIGSAFDLGEKAGGWVDSLLGIGPGPAPGMVPNGDIGTDPKGWVTNPPPYAATLATYPQFNMAAANGSVSVSWGVAIDPAVFTFGKTGTILPYNVTSGGSAGTAYPGVTLTATVSGSFPASSVAPFGDDVYLFAYCGASSTPAGHSNLGVYFRGAGGYTVTSFTGNGGSQQCNGSSGFDHLVLGNLSGSVVYGKWYPVGHTSRPASVDPNPLRHWSMRTTCTDTAAPVLVANSASFHETDSPFPGWPAVGDCTGHGMVKSWQLLEVNESTGGTRVINSWATPTTVETLRTNHPECLTNGADNEKCGTTLWKLDASTGLWTDCFKVSGLCAGWATDPNRSTDYKCTYGLLAATAPAGLEDVGLTGCYQYGPTFDPAKRAQGKTISAPGVDPDTDPNGDNDEADPNPASSPLPGASGGSSCWPSGFSSLFNPVEWILAPIKCALVWAFVPSASDVSDLWRDTWGTVSSRPPVSLVTAFIGPVQQFAGAVQSGCTGYLADFSDGVQIPCAPDWAFYSVLRTAMSGAVLVFFGWRIWRVAESAISRPQAVTA